MALGPFGLPVGLPPEIERYFRGFASFWDSQQRVSVLGVLPSGDDVVVRLLASRAATFVRAHVQHNGGGGGGEAFNSTVFVSDVRVDCRVNRQQDYTVVRSTASDYFLWLIPEFLGDDGTTYTRFDGATDNGDDKMAFIALGSNSAAVKALQFEIEQMNEKFDRLLTYMSIVVSGTIDHGEK